MQFRTLLLIPLLFFIITLTACTGNSGGTPRVPVNLEAYGLVTGPTVMDSKSYSVESLQNFLTPYPLNSNIGKDKTITATGICQSLVLADTSYQQPPYDRFLGNGLCALNIGYTQKIIESSIPIPELLDFVKDNKAGVADTKFYRFIYNTPGAPYIHSGGATTPQNVSGLIIVPRDSNGKPLTSDKIKGVLLYFHQTITSKGGVPSDFDATDSVNLANALDTDLVLAAVYASQGYVVVAPDYVGQGVNRDVQHPYTAFGITNAQSGIYALKAARQALADQGINLPIPANVYISSFSEGGAYALWASKLMQGQYAEVLKNSGYKLRRTIGVHGAYDLSDTMLPYMYSNASNSWDPAINVWNTSPGMFESGISITLEPFGTISIVPESAYPSLRALAALEIAGSKVVLSGYLLTSLVYYNSTKAAYISLSYPNYFNVLQCLNVKDWVAGATTLPDASTMPCPQLRGRNYDLAGLFNDTSGVLNTSDIFMQTLSNTFATRGFVVSDQSFDSLFKAMQQGFSNNNISAFIQNIIGDTIVMQNISNQDIFSWSTNSPVEIIYLKYDSVVPNINSLKACGLAKGYAPGVKDLSPKGMVNCTEIDNTTLFQQRLLPGVNFPVPPPVFMDHGFSEAVSQIVALTKFMVNP